MFKVIDPGLQTTIQDQGRYGYYHLGVPPAGAADKYSYQLGNLLLGNPIEAAAIEMTILGPVIEVLKDTVIVVTGAPILCYLNGDPMAMWTNIRVRKGDYLMFKPQKKSTGVYSYLCVSGGINIQKILGSRSAYLLSDFDGFLSKKLEKDDVIVSSEPLPGVFKLVGRTLDQSHIPNFSKHLDVRVVMGLSSDRITDAGITNFLTHEWTVQNESNRVASRLKGADIPYNDCEPSFGSGHNIGNVVDMAYPIGAILVPNSEEVICLLNDATGGGGFVTMGTVISSDLDKISQAMPFSKIRFHAVTVKKAIEYRLARKKEVAKLYEMFH
ncbi:biotin-dependent carboxylase-like uncharacterized protein [Bacillus ectoiniformans]|uniref:5-oxoprolinase subunit C family protein n=1 Tax=Bacillus ectoiniformans TaxID=1494429 RepID=UPI0019562442|nr:biotin-dependent carboxyltransferase family protein [Bacillus ectoiniformans]MBM7649821.1 biotin-dependent carboxylase-like uncharacterized protein [Bacillus ectoiniformans]